MLYIFNRAEELTAILEQGNKEACPYYGASIKSVLNGEEILNFRAPLDNDQAKTIEELGYVALKNKYKQWKLFLITEIVEVHSDIIEIEVTAEGAFVELDNVIIESQIIDRKQPSTVLPTLLAGTRWEAGNISGTEIHDLTVKHKSVLFALQEFRERWHGELRFRVEIAGNKIARRIVDFSPSKGTWKGKRFEYSKDIQEIQRTIDCKSVKTALYGLGSDITVTEATETAEAVKEPLTFTTLLHYPKGRFIGEININKNYAGAVNDGEIQITTTAGNEVLHPLGQSYTVKGGTELSTHLEGSVVDTFYIMYVGQDYSRFAPKPYTNSTEDFIYCKVINGAWYFYKNTSTAIAFTPNWKIDCLVAEITKTATTGGIQTLIKYDVTAPYKPSGQAYIGDESALAVFGKALGTDNTKRHLFGVVDFSTESQEELLKLTWEHLQTIKDPLVTYQMRVLDLYRLLGIEAESVDLGDLCAIIDKDLGLTLQARVIEYHEDLEFAENDEITLGNFQPKFTSENTQEQLSDIARKVDTVYNRPFLEIGDTISPTWLDTEFDFAKEAIRAGNGTVSITQGDGILIVDDPTNPQKAIKLQAGQIALANTRDLTTGEFNWRNFGTGEGWLADLIQAGKISFNNATGGTLTLGGIDNVNGTLEVVNATGDKIVTLTGETGGFNELFVGTIRGNNVVTFNTKGSYTMYVDTVAGSNDNDGLTTATAFKTLQYAIDQIPKFNNYSINIVIQGTGITFVENVEVIGIMGAGRIGIYLGRKNIMKGYFLIKNNMNEVFIGTVVGTTTTTATVGADRGQIQGQANTNGSSVVYSFMNMMCNLYDIIISGNAVVSYGFNAYNGVTRLQYCEIYNCTAYAGIFQANGSGDVTSCAGSNPRGLRIAHGTTIGGSGTGFYSEIAGQEKVVDQGAVCNVTWSYNAGAKTPTYAPVTVSTWSANDTHSLYGTNWGLTTDYIMFGQRSTSEVGWYGFAFFNTANFGALKNADGTNRPITKVRIKVQRYNGYGDNNSRKPTIYYNAQTSASGSVATLYGKTTSNVGFLWGEEKWIDLPTSYGTAFRDGTAESIVFYNGNDLANYMRFEAKCTLEITHG